MVNNMQNMQNYTEQAMSCLNTFTASKQLPLPVKEVVFI